MIINKDNLYLHVRSFQKHLFPSCCVTSFFSRCPDYPTFRLLQWSFVTQIITTGSQIISNSNYKPLTRFKDLSGNLSLKLLRDVIFLSLPDQSDIYCFTIPNFQSDEYPWKLNFSNHIKFKLKTCNQIQIAFRKSQFEVAV